MAATVRIWLEDRGDLPRPADVLDGYDAWMHEPCWREALLVLGLDEAARLPRATALGDADAFDGAMEAYGAAHLERFGAVPADDDPCIAFLSRCKAYCEACHTRARLLLLPSRAAR